jgi:hypothetical protein
MTSLDVASLAASSPAARVPGTITGRKVLWTGGIIEITVPKVVRAGMFLDNDKDIEIPFIQFARTVKGGMVNLFIHTDTPDAYAGKTIHANLKIHQKDYEDGRSFINIDLEPVEGPPTKRLLIEDRTRLSAPDDSVVFDTPAPLLARIIIAPPQLKKAEPANAKISTGDTQLDRYLRDGWVISHQDEKTVNLTKGERSFTHHKPKSKGKKHGHR